MSSQNNIFQRYYEQQDKNEELRPADTIKDQILSTYNLVARTVKLFDFFIGTLAHTLVGTLKMFSDVSRESPNDDGDLPNAMETKSSKNIK